MRISHSGKKLVVISGGDPSGIGPETILKALSILSPFKDFTPLIVGDYSIFCKTARSLKFDISQMKQGRYDKHGLGEGAVNFIDLANVSSKNFRFGKLNKIYGKASMEYVLCGLSILKSLKRRALVTAPINKEAINKAGFKFAGHTELLRETLGVKGVTMMLVGGTLRVSLVTRHIALKDVSRYLTRGKIIQTIGDTHHALKVFFKVPRPRIGVCGLNPHAGEGGVLGKEEKKLILPAVKSLKKKIKGLRGPIAADALFYKARKGELDAVVCMYHDQGLIPLKMTAFEKGVNITLGLPFIRTSPDHGTGFDIAGKGKANPSSMVEAIKLAVKL